MPYTLTLALTLAACFGIQALALRAVGGRTTKSESNFFSSLGRIQSGAQGKPEIIVLGSSLTGRLPDRAQGFAGVANMGCDGGYAMDALRAMDVGILPNASVIVIEANTMRFALDGKPTEIGRAMQRPWFRVGLKFPCLSAYARPAAFLYSRLLVRRIGQIGRLAHDADLGVTSRPALITDIPREPLTPRQTEVIREISGVLGRLQVMGSRTMIVWLPPARGDASPPPEWILELARQSGSTWWDLGQAAAPGTVVLSDGVHMDAPSAARTTISLLNAIKDGETGR
jgi:hypothetical protein